MWLECIWTGKLNWIDKKQYDLIVLNWNTSYDIKH